MRLFFHIFRVLSTALPNFFVSDHIFLPTQEILAGKRGENMDTFVCATRLCFGQDALQALSTLQAKRVLLVTDPFFVRNGTAQRVLSNFPDAETEIFDRVTAEPSLTLVAEGVEVFRRLRPDTVLALGGGSALDCAKGIVSMCGERPRLVAVPTTSGTGSEVTSFAILMHDGVKHPLIDEALRPELAILDASLLENLPKSVIADAGMDVLTHCLEAFVSKNATLFTSALAASAFRTALAQLPASYMGDVSVRAEIHQAATMAGIAFDNAGLGVCHALSHALGGRFHLAHGRLNAILLPHIVRFNAVAAASAYGALAAQCRLSGVPGLCFALTRLRRKLELPESLTAAGLERSEVLANADALCRAALADPCLAANPREVSLHDLYGLLEAAL